MRKNSPVDELRNMERRNAARAEKARREGNDVYAAKYQNLSNRAATRLTSARRASA